MIRFSEKKTELLATIRRWLDNLRKFLRLGAGEDSVKLRSQFDEIQQAVSIESYRVVRQLRYHASLYSERKDVR
jgi:hypothetical protein